MLRFLLSLFIFLHLNATAEEKFEVSRLNAHQFTLGYVGFVGHISEAEKYMDVISKSPNAVQVFAKVIDDGSSTRVAKLYALCGMKKAGGAELEAYATKIMKVGGTVSTMYADQMKKEDISFFVNRIKYQECNN